MTLQSFSSLISSLQNGKSIQPVKPAPSQIGPRRQEQQVDARAQPARDGLAAAGTKRKLEDVQNEDVRKASRPSSMATISTVAKPSAARPNTTSCTPAPKLVDRTSVAATSRTAASKPAMAVKVQNPITTAPRPSVNQQATAAPKARGFASLMAKAAAAQEMSRASGPDTIKHKPLQKLSRREKARQAQEAEQAALEQKHTQGSKTIKLGHNSGPMPVGKKNRLNAVPKVVYQGTMRANQPANQVPSKPQKGQAQDKYGGYASWSDLDEAEDDDQGSYDSASDMEEAGYDEVMEEELRSARLAKREDDEAQQEEEKHKREKLERKKRLMALNETAASARKRF